MRPYIDALVKVEDRVERILLHFRLVLERSKGEGYVWVGSHSGEFHCFHDLESDRGKRK